MGEAGLSCSLAPNERGHNSFFSLGLPRVFLNFTSAVGHLASVSLRLSLSIYAKG